MLCSMHMHALGSCASKPPNLPTSLQKGQLGAGRTSSLRTSKFCSPFMTLSMFLSNQSPQSPYLSK